MDVREKLVEIVCDAMEADGCIGHCNHPPCFAVERVVNALSAHGVTVQECGHWEDDHGDYVCSCCHTAFTDDLIWLVRGESNEPNYCPNCGAKMMPQPPKGE